MKAALDRFVDAWGSLGALFGFSRSTARVSALLMASAEPLSLGQIAERLQISRGNASMCLKELRGWGVARRIPVPGKRQDYYVSDGDIWGMAIDIARGRKRREFDPAVRDALGALADLSAGPGAERAAQIEDFLQTLERFGVQILENDSAVTSLVGLLRSSLQRSES